MTNEDGRIGAVLNGEIYNFSALRDELRRRDHQLRTRGDTEVLAHLSEDLPPAKLADRLEGMFAFAVWDGAQLVLGRDRLGKKPLYYWIGDGRLVFASEIKGLLAHPWVPRDPEPSALDAYLTFGYVPCPATFFAGIYSLPPGHVATFRPGDTAVTLEQYWSLSHAVELADMRLAEGNGSVREVRSVLDRAVAKRMVADVPMGAFLSGGVDSSTVVALMTEHSDRRVATFTIGFDDDEGFDERPYARLVAKTLGTDHHEFVVQPDTASLIERLVECHDQPFGDSSALPTFLLSELTRQHVTVALSGDGGDEVFAGYERFAAAMALARLQILPKMVLDRFQSAIEIVPAAVLRGHQGSLRRFLRRRDLTPHRALLSWVSYTTEEWRERLLPGASGWGYAAYDELWKATRGMDRLARLQALTISTYLLDDLLVKVDRTSMAHALEVRSPLLDPEVVACGLALRPGAKVAGMSLKRIMKRAMAERLPQEILSRGKRGFGIPLDRWFRTDLSRLLEGALGSKSSRVRNHLNAQALDALLEEHRTGLANHGHTLWTLVTLELFLQREKW